MTVKLHGVQRQAVRVRMILAVLRETLLAQSDGPGQHRQAVREQGREILKGPWSGSGRRAEPHRRGRRRSGRYSSIPDSR